MYVSSYIVYYFIIYRLLFVCIYHHISFIICIFALLYKKLNISQIKN